MIGARLLSVVSVSHFRSEFLKTALTLLGMSLGIAVYFAIRAANENAWESFISSTKLVAPDDVPRLTSESGEISETLVPSLLKVPEIIGVSPRSIAYIGAFSGAKSLGTVQVLGVDFATGKSGRSGNGDSNGERKDENSGSGSGLDLLRKHNAVLISPQLSERLADKQLGVLVNGTERSLEVAGLLPENGLARAYGGQLVLIDITHFQDLFETWGKVNEVALDVAPGVSIVVLEEKLARVLPAQVSLAKPDDNARHAEKMSQAFRLNLGFLSAISLLVAVFLIYNTTSYSTLKRRDEFNTLRCIGLSRRDILVFLTLENALFGLAGSALGIVLGYVLASGSVKLVSASFNTLYLPVHVGEVHIHLALIVSCLLLGPAIALLGSIWPVLEVTSRAPRETATYQQFEQAFTGRLPKFILLALLLFVLSAVTTNRRLLEESIYAGFLSPTFLIFGMAFLTPALLLGLLFAGRWILRPFGAEILLALDHIQMTLRRNSVAVAAVIISTGMFIGLSVMILSFRQTVQDWIAHITAADVYVGTRSSVAGPSSGYLPDEVVKFLSTSPRAADFDWVASTKVYFGDRQARVSGVRFDNLAQHDRLLFKQTMNHEDAKKLFSETGIALVSESFAERNKVSIGDFINLPGVSDKVRLRVGNIFYDYSSDQGLVMIPDKLFESLFQEKRKQGVSLYLSPGNTPEQVRDDVSARFPNSALIVRSNKNLREEVIKVFDDTFKITYALQGIVLFISTLTVVNTVLMLILERRREFAVLRAIGASRWSLAKMVSFESFLIGAAGALGAVLLGLMLAVLLVFVVNQFFFGWSTRFIIPLPQLILTSAGVLVLSFFSGLLPGLLVAKKLDGSALSYE